jgi:hypothetical protein
MSAHQHHKKSLLEGLDLVHPVFRGHMFKQSHTHKSFNKRYFVLYPKVLVYYDTEHDYMRDVERKTLEVSQMLEPSWLCRKLSMQYSLYENTPSP